MPKKKETSLIIQGICPDFICNCCRTKYGFVHQPWCDKKPVLKPHCSDCGYYNFQHDKCDYPVHKRNKMENTVQ